MAIALKLGPPVTSEDKQNLGVIPGCPFDIPKIFHTKVICEDLKHMVRTLEPVERLLDYQLDGN